MARETSHIAFKSRGEGTAGGGEKEGTRGGWGRGVRVRGFQARGVQTPPILFHLNIKHAGYNKVD